MSYVINFPFSSLHSFSFWVIFRQILVKSFEFMAGHLVHPWGEEVSLTPCQAKKLLLDVI